MPRRYAPRKDDLISISLVVSSGGNPDEQRISRKAGQNQGFVRHADYIFSLDSRLRGNDEPHYIEGITRSAASARYGSKSAKESSSSNCKSIKRTFGKPRTAPSDTHG